MIVQAINAEFYGDYSRIHRAHMERLALSQQPPSPAPPVPPPPLPEPKPRDD